MQMEFYKYQGTGNDFIILDNRDGKYNGLSNEAINKLCDRNFGIGADGLMLLELADGYDFRMNYHNADGMEGSMCGNGGRCLVQFAKDMGIEKTHYRFIAVDGEHEAEIKPDGLIRLKMQDVFGVTDIRGDVVLNTGSPHFIRFVDTVDHVDIFSEGTKIRYNDTYANEGINVNFVEQTDNGIRIRTYERGVEDETLSCGTGATAAAIASATEDGPQIVSVAVQGGHLEIAFNRINPNQFSDIWLIGPAAFVFRGTI